MQTRRQFVRTAGAAGAVVLAPPALAAAQSRERRPFRGGRFDQGVISGDPTPRSIVLWTHVDGVSGSGTVELEVARDRGFRRVVARERVRTSGAVGHAVKARVTGLRPHEEYFFRFATVGEESRVGRFRTALPPDSRQPVRFAFFSCQDYTDGFYNAHRLMAREDVDFAVNLGDYIYAETYNTSSSPDGVRDDRIGQEGVGNPGALRSAVSLGDYRAKYALYRSDPDLQAMHAAFPMISTWDDHEVQDNWAGGERDGGDLIARAKFSRRRKRNAYRAFFESMPLFAPGGGSRIYRSLRFGRTVEIVVMDQRQYRENQPCGDRVTSPCAEWDRPRDFLGRRQMRWVKDRLAGSPAAWKVLANELMVMPFKVGDSYGTYDAWIGYPREREELLAHIDARRIRDVVFVTGDIHAFFAGDVRREVGTGEPVALEFVGGSITSEGVGAGLAGALREAGPWFDQVDTGSNGYGIARATQRGLDVEMRRLVTVEERSTALQTTGPWRYQVARGQRSIKGAGGR